MNKILSLLFALLFVKFTLADPAQIELSQIVAKLKELADPALASDWDNVGLMVEPSTKPFWVNRIMLTNDLTEPVFDEALKKGAQLIISYHPVISKRTPITALTQSQWKTRMLIKCIEHGIAVYSPHTSWDSFDGGINDWILNFFNSTAVEAVKPVQDWHQLTGFDVNIRVDLSESVENNTHFRRLLRNKEIKFMGEMDLFKGYTSTQSGLVEAEFMATQQGFLDIVDCIRKHQPAALKTLRSSALEKPILKNVGLGRHATLAEPESIHSILARLKKIFKLEHVRFALANGRTLESLVSNVVVSAGSAQETFWKFSQSADLLICGELNHHELLKSTHDGMSVIMTEHSNSERCFLESFKDMLATQLNTLNKDMHMDIWVSEADHDPVTFF